MNDGQSRQRAAKRFMISIVTACAMIYPVVTSYSQMINSDGSDGSLIEVSGRSEELIDLDGPLRLVDGLIESASQSDFGTSAVYVDEAAAFAVRPSGILSNDGIAMRTDRGSIAEILESPQEESDTVRVKSSATLNFDPPMQEPNDPDVHRVPISEEKRSLTSDSPVPQIKDTVPQESNRSVERLISRSDVTLVSQAPLIDEPLGSGLATPSVSRGGALPPPVLLERLPPPAKGSEVYEIVPNGVGSESEEQTFILPSDDSTTEDSSVWVESVDNEASKKPVRRGRLERFAKRLEPVRPMNLFDHGLYLATEFTFLSSSQVAKSQVDVADLLSDAEHSAESAGAFGYGQRSVIGLQGEVFGFEAIYWDYGSREYESGSWKPPYIFEQYTRGQSVDLSTLDLEITQKFCIAGVDWGTAIGLRKMDYVGHSSAFSLATYHDQQVEVSSSALAKNRLEGIGPTFAIRGRKSISRFCDQGIYGTGFFWDTRLSWLWSDSSSSAITEASAVSTTYDNPTVSRSLDHAYTISDDPELRMHAGLQLGVECWRAVGCRSRLVSRVAFEYQYFEQSDDYSMANSYAYLTDSINFGAAASALAENSGRDLNMFGFTLLVGINY